MRSLSADVQALEDDFEALDRNGSQAALTLRGRF